MHIGHGYGSSAIFNDFFIQIETNYCQCRAVGSLHIVATDFNPSTGSLIWYKRAVGLADF